MKLTENTRLRVRVPKHLYEAIQAELAKKHDMEEMKVPHDGHEKMEEEKVEEDVTRGAEIAAKEMMGAISSGDPFATGVALVGAVVAGVIAGPKVVDTIKGYWKALTQKDPTKADKLAKAAEKAGMDVDGVKEASAQPEVEMEEALDLETLMEAVKHAAKKKAEDKKKKHEEEKKKKEVEDKKKKEAEAKKKADAKKKK